MARDKSQTTPKMRFKIVACILLILPIFSFVLAAPVPVRAPRGKSYDGSESESDMEWWTTSTKELQSQPQSPSPLDYASASGSHPGDGMPPPPSPAGGNSPLWSKVWSTPGGTEVAWDTEEGVFKPGSTTENRPVSPSTAKAISWSPLKKVQLPSGDVIRTPLQSDIKLVPSPPPGREGYLAKAAAQQLPPQLPPQLPQKPQSKGFVAKFKKVFAKLAGKLKFWPTS